MDKKVNKNRERRMRIINQILNTIINSSEKEIRIDYKKLISLISFEKGVSKRTAKEYIDILIDIEKVELKNGKLLAKIETFK